MLVYDYLIVLYFKTNKKMSDNKNVNFVVRRMQLSDCEEVREIWTLLTFLVSKYDNEVMMKVDEKGIFVAQDLNTGKLLGVCSGVVVSPDLAFIGQYGVRPEYQNLRIGSELWRVTMDHIGVDRNIGLYARGVMLQKYRDKCNFKFISTKVGLCFTGKVDSNKLIQEINGISVVPINEENIEQVIQYDREVCNGLDRTILIQEISKINEYVTAVAVNKTNDILGYCVLKVSNFNTGIVEPLYANDEKIAELLFAKCCQSMAITQTNGVIYPCWDSNKNSIAIAKKINLQLMRKLPILFTKKIIDGSMDRIFCMSSRAFYPF